MGLNELTQVRDWSLWDDAPAMGVMDTTRLQSRTLPSFYYVGIAREFQDLTGCLPYPIHTLHLLLPWHLPAGDGMR